MMYLSPKVRKIAKEVCLSQTYPRRDPLSWDVEEEVVVKIPLMEKKNQDRLFGETRIVVGFAGG